jgi:uncharacterized protein YebE (UPF0316 family)
MMEFFAGPWGPALIFALRVVDVSMGTMRVLTVVRGARSLAALISFFEILIWVVAAGAVIQNLSSPLHAVGYAGGFAAGTAVGMWLEGKLALGVCSVRVFSTHSQQALVETLREQGYGVTEQEGKGREGPVAILHAVVRRRDVRDVTRTVEKYDPDAFVTIQNDAVVHRGWLLAAKRR